MFALSHLSLLASSLRASMAWCAVCEGTQSKQDRTYTANRPSSILFANPEEGT